MQHPELCLTFKGSTGVWEIVLYLNFATVAGFLLFCAVIPWAAAALEARTERVISVLSRGFLVMIEVVQYVMNAGRTVDVDDVLFNTLGGLMGAVLAFLPRRALMRGDGGETMAPATV